jgi:hypothetical protein
MYSVGHGTKSLLDRPSAVAPSYGLDSALHSLNSVFLPVFIPTRCLHVLRYLFWLPVWPVLPVLPALPAGLPSFKANYIA